MMKIKLVMNLKIIKWFGDKFKIVMEIIYGQILFYFLHRETIKNKMILYELDGLKE